MSGTLSARNLTEKGRCVIAVAGKDGYIGLPTNTNLALSSWDWDANVDLLDVTTFTSAGAKENIAGLKGSKFSASGPYAPGAMAITAGSTYATTLAVNSTISFVVTFRIGTIKIVTDVKKETTVNVTGESTGAFNAVIT